MGNTMQARIKTQSGCGGIHTRESCMLIWSSPSPGKSECDPEGVCTQSGSEHTSAASSFTRSQAERFPMLLSAIQRNARALDECFLTPPSSPREHKWGAREMRQAKSAHLMQSSSADGGTQCVRWHRRSSRHGDVKGATYGTLQTTRQNRCEPSREN